MAITSIGKGEAQWSERLAYALSHLFSPAGVALVLFAFLSQLTGGRWLAGVVGVVWYGIIPAAVMLYLKSSGRLTELYDPEPGQRRWILRVGVVCYALGYAVLSLVGAPDIILWCAASFCGGALLVTLINGYWKISIHSVGVGGGLLILMVVGGWGLWPAGVAAAAVAWARLRLGAHSPVQVVAGLALGTLQSWGLLALYE